MNATSFRRPEGAPPYVFGHRGVRGAAPENTMAAFELAAESGADGVELDVRLCRTGQLVVCHDPTLARFTGGRDERKIADLDLAELARADVEERTSNGDLSSSHRGASRSTGGGHSQRCSGQITRRASLSRSISVS